MGRCTDTDIAAIGIVNVVAGSNHWPGLAPRHTPLTAKQPLVRLMPPLALKVEVPV